jgi:hypothetical protein
VKGSKEEAPVWPRALAVCVYKKLSYTFEWCALIFLLSSVGSSEKKTGWSLESSFLCWAPQPQPPPLKTRNDAIQNQIMFVRLS